MARAFSVFFLFSMSCWSVSSFQLPLLLCLFTTLNFIVWSPLSAPANPLSLLRETHDRRPVLLRTADFSAKSRICWGDPRCLRRHWRVAGHPLFLRFFSVGVRVAAPVCVPASGNKRHVEVRETTEMLQRISSSLAAPRIAERGGCFYKRCISQFRGTQHFSQRNSSEKAHLVDLGRVPVLPLLKEVSASCSEFSVGEFSPLASASAEHASVKARIEACDEAYYGGSEEIVSDGVYDALKKRLLFLEEKYPSLKSPSSPSVQVGFSRSCKEASWRHLEPVLSLDGVYSLSEASRQFRRIAKFVQSATAKTPEAKATSPRRKENRKSKAASQRHFVAAETPPQEKSDEVPSSFFPEFFAEPKVDGLSLALTYFRSEDAEEDSSSGVYRLARGATRGDGRCGEDVTSKVLFLAGIGLLPATFSLRTDFASSADASGELTEPASSLRASRRSPPSVMEIRGELFVPLDAFVALNTRRRKAGARVFSSPRSALSFHVADKVLAAACLNLLIAKPSLYAFPPFRHAATGILRRLEEQRCVEEEKILRFCAYGLVASWEPAEKASSQGALVGAPLLCQTSRQLASSQAHLLQLLEEWKFVTLRKYSRVVRSEEEAAEAFRFLEEKRRAYDIAVESGEQSRESGTIMHAQLSSHEDENSSLSVKNIPSLEQISCDGVVFKLSSLSMQRSLGNTARAPRWAFAVKFKSGFVQSRVKSLHWTVGASGVCIPVAEFEPVLVGGVNVCKASLHSPQNLRRKDVRVGDVVCLRLKGEAVPQIETVVYEARKNTQSLPTAATALPSRCPSCGAPLVTRSSARQKTSKEDGSTLRCLAGWDCPAQRVSRLTRFFSKQGLEVSGVGAKTLVALESRGYVKTPCDLFKTEQTDAAKRALGEDGIAGWSGWGVAAREALFGAIQKTRSRGVPLHRLLFALGIPGLGTSAAEFIARRVQTLDGFLDFLDSIASRSDSASAEAEAKDSSQEQEEKGKKEIASRFPLDTALLRELEVFGADTSNREQLKELGALLYIHPAKG